ncbi:hypothetical protein [Sphingopyxis sp.]|uniref:hypothetical protein n=1 Tax=Sphingopyxis sp. TaxID=1908224 RepID=UPI003D09A561
MKQAFALINAILALAVGAASAQAAYATPAPIPMTPGLPVAEGAWVDAKSKCNNAQETWVYNGSTFGIANLNPYAGSQFDPIDNLARVKDGFVRINGGPWEIKALPDGRAVVRTYSLAEGEIGRTTLRRCEPATLPPTVRTSVERGLVRTARHPVYVPGRANGNWAIALDGTTKGAQFSGDGLIKTFTLSCRDGKDAGPDKVKLSLGLTKAAPVTATRLALVYHDGGSLALSTALYHLAEDDRWIGPADDGLADRLDISSRIIIDMGPAGAEEIPLTGSSAAIREALSSCWRSRR